MPDKLLDAPRLGWDRYGRRALSMFPAGPDSIVLDDRPTDPPPAPKIHIRPWRKQDHDDTLAASNRRDRTQPKE